MMEYGGIKCTFMSGNAVKRAAENMLFQMKEIAAQALRSPVDQPHGYYIYHVHHQTKDPLHSDLLGLCLLKTEMPLVGTNFPWCLYGG